MLIDRFNQDNFDEVLERAVQRHSEPVPADFTEGVLRRIKEAEQQKVLARVVLQERLALTGSIVLGSVCILVMVVFSSYVTTLLQMFGNGFVNQGRALINKAPEIIGVISRERQFFVVLAAVFGFAVYGLVDLLAANSE